MRAKRSLPEQAYLRECFDYDALIGILTWRERPLSHFQKGAVQSQAWVRQRWNSRMGGKPAGCLADPGYLGCTLNGRRELLHRVIWKLVTGDEVPQIDHRDTNRTNNRWRNLRAADSQKNTWNSKGKRIGRLKGTSFNKSRGTYTGSIRGGPKREHKGGFLTEEAAHAWYCERSREIHGEWHNPG